MRGKFPWLLIASVPILGSLLFNGAAEAQPFGPRIELPFVIWFADVKSHPIAPFVQSQAEARRIAGILKRWEAAGRNTRSFSCHFMRWDYDFTWGPQQNDSLMSERHGTIAYRAPDNGAFRETEMKTYDAAKGKYICSSENLEHWLCDGRHVFWLHFKTQSIDIISVPPDRWNRMTVDGPVPFFYPIDAAALLKRFWFREITPREQIGKQLWLDAWPKNNAEAAFIQRFEIILNLPDFTPVGHQITPRNGRDRTVYLFEDYRQNEASAVSLNDFTPPAFTTFWKWQRLPPPTDPAKTVTPALEAVPRATAVLAAPGGGADGTGCCRQNRSRANRGRLVHSRPGSSRFCRQGRVSCRIRCCGKFRRWCR
jgi:hypothetical protein